MEQADAQPAVHKTKSSGGQIVLQWLSYAFWGWLSISLIWLVALVLTHFIADAQTGASIAYALATNIVLLPVAFVTDHFYRKHEPAEKAGGANVVMIIHTVIFTLLGIGALIGAVFVAVSMIVEGTDNVDEQIVALLTLLISSALFMTLFLRVLNPFRWARLARSYAVAILGFTIIFLGLAIGGPVVRSVAARDDQRIEHNLSGVYRGINRYVDDNEALPSNLAQAKYTTDDATALAKSGDVRYQRDEAPVSGNQSDSYGSLKKFYYQLCVTYKYEKEAGFSSDFGGGNSVQYNRSVSTYSHPKGDVCYKLVTTTYTNNQY